MSTPVGGAPVNPLQFTYDPTDVVSSRPLQQTSTIQASVATGPVTSLQVLLPEPAISYVDYLAIVITNLTIAKRQLQETQLADDTSTREQFLVLAQTALNNLNLLEVLRQQILSAATKAATASANIKGSLVQANKTIDTYNSGDGVEYTDPLDNSIKVTNNGLSTDQSEWDRLNNAINDFNSAQNTFNSAQSAYYAVINNPNSTQDQIDDATDDFNQAQTTFNQAQADFAKAGERYNFYVSIRNPNIQAYNDLAAPPGTGPGHPNLNDRIQEYNAAVADLNAIGAADGVDPIPSLPLLTQRTLLEQYIGALPPPPSNASVANIEDPSDKVANAQVTYNNYYDAIVKAFQDALKNASKNLQNTEAFYDVIKYYIGNLSKADAPAAFLNVSLGTDEKPTGSGSPAGQGESLSNTELQELVSQAMQTEQLKPVTDPTKQIIEPKAINQLGIAFLQTLGLAAVVPSLALLRDKFSTLGPGSQALDTALQAQTLLNLVGALNTTDVLNELDAALKLRLPDITAEEIKAISAALQIALVSVLVALLGNSLNLPGLAAQLFALASGKSESEAVAAQNQPPQSLNNALQDQLVLQQLQKLISDLTKLSAADADKVVADAINQASQDQQRKASEDRNQAVLKDLKRLDDFHNAVLAALKEKDVANAQANVAAIKAQDLLRSQIQSQNLQTAQLNADNLRSDILEQSIAASLRKADIAKSQEASLAIAKQVSLNVFGSSRNLTDAQIRNNLEIELPKVTTLTPQQAALVADQARIVPKTPEGVNPLTQTKISEGLTKPELALNLTESVINKLSPSVGYSKATELASLVTQTQVGAADREAAQNNALELITDRTHFINSLETKKDVEIAVNTSRDFFTEHSDLGVIGNKIRDPAKILVNDGIIYSQPTPTQGMGQAGDVSPVSIRAIQA